MSRRPGGAPPPSVPRRPSRVIRPAKTGGNKGCPLSLLFLAIAVTVGLGVGGCGPAKQAQQPHPLRTARQHAP